ncbi:MAG: redox-sensing transcriptional repressor Rex, partial [Clostridiales bacterium 43-6]
MDKTKPISVQALKRLPMYLNHLKALPESSVYVSATQISQALELHDVQVRKDLASISSGGKPKIGYLVNSLIFDIESYLGYHDTDRAVLIGAGKLGHALMSYKGFSKYNLDIIAAFDNDEKKIGTKIGSKQVLSTNQLVGLCRRMKIKIGIITVPETEAQPICDLLVDSGIVAIWNFAQIKLNTP